MVTLKRKRKWEWNVYLPDGASWYEWDLCVEKVGFVSAALAEPEFREPIRLVLSASSERMECRWPENSNWAPEVVHVD